MTRHLFGFSGADLAMERVEDELRLRPGSVGTVYGSRTGSDVLTDLQTADGTAISVVTADADANVGFLGPDDDTSLVWIDFGYGRFAMTATDLGALVAGKVNRAGDTITGDLIVNGTTSLGGSLGVTGTPTFESDAVFEGDVDITGDLRVLGTYPSGGGGGGASDGPGTLVTGLDLGTGSGTDAAGNRTKILNAMAAVATDSAGLIRLPKGKIRFGPGRITVPDGIGFQAEGGGDLYVGTTLIPVASGDGITVGGDSGKIAHFKVDGNGVANYPIILEIGAHRIFEQVAGVNALLDNWTINKMQNSIFLRCQSKTATRHNIVMDYGCGGLAWYDLESAVPGVSHLKVQQTGASADVYSEPSHVTFHHSLFENGTADAPLLDFDEGFDFKFDQCVLQSNRTSATTEAMVDLADGVGPVIWEDGHITNAAGGAWTAFRTHGFSRLVISGRPVIVNNVSTFIDNPAGEVKIFGEPAFYSATAWVSAGTPSGGDQNVNIDRRSPILFGKHAVTAVALEGRVLTEAGARFRLLADGTMQYGNGTNYAFPLSLFRGSDGFLHVGGAAPSVTGAKGGNAALTSLLSQLATLGIIVNNTT